MLSRLVDRLDITGASPSFTVTVKEQVLDGLAVSV